MLLKWGVAGAGRISHDFVIAVETYPPENHRFIAVASKSKATAQTFATEHGIPKFYEGYERLAEDGDIDIVYVGNLNTQHFETVKIMLEHGKHVLCEKPMAINKKQTAKLIEIAKEKNRLLLQGIWSRHFPVYHEMKNLIRDGVIGEVMHVSVNLGFPLNAMERVMSKAFGGGAIMDLGINVFQFCQYVFDRLTPTKMAINGHLNENDVDESCGIVLTYNGAKMAVASVSTAVDLPNVAFVVGTKGTLRIPTFWSPTQMIVNDQSYSYWYLPKARMSFFYENSVGLRYQAEHARELLMKGLIESPIVPHEDSVELANLLDLARKEIGNVFPEDSEEY